MKTRIKPIANAGAAGADAAQECIIFPTAAHREMGSVVGGSSNRLAILAVEVRSEHAGIAQSLARGLRHAITAGELLIEAKALLKHGEWLPWLSAHCELSERTARLYMRLAKNRARIEAEIGNVADLSVRGALALIAPPEASQLSHFAPLAVATALDEAELSALEHARSERQRRRLAAATAQQALRKIMALAAERQSASTAADSVWQALGEQLLAAISEYQELAIAERPGATAAALRTKDLAVEMLRQVEAATLVSVAAV
ncbi:DUF3102 domain-containing protein [Bradyrhizobium sp. CIR3A]|uniref:DUF3102 domain-containing protein n=1 Tax=Bradyrhizobium sp. CIR3A TaxID=2663838 RepID=UPI001606B1C0|nr:DUF3102 domain-containing protein [Bradyrhizobium sp. CIR3A]MBB4259971.1 hypothetical protein [Bradyrhizobium sp. CIR3A]